MNFARSAVFAEVCGLRVLLVVTVIDRLLK